MDDNCNNYIEIVCKNIWKNGLEILTPIQQVTGWWIGKYHTVMLYGANHFKRTINKK